jgi:hypothetical protein
MDKKTQTSELEDHLGYWLRYVSNHVSHAFAQRVEKKGVTVAEWALMREMLKIGPANPSQLAERLGMTRGAISNSSTDSARKICANEARPLMIAVTKPWNSQRRASDLYRRLLDWPTRTTANSLATSTASKKQIWRRRSKKSSAVTVGKTFLSINAARSIEHSLPIWS